MKGPFRTDPVLKGPFMTFTAARPLSCPATSENSRPTSRGTHLRALANNKGPGATPDVAHRPFAVRGPSPDDPRSPPSGWAPTLIPERSSSSHNRTTPTHKIKAIHSQGRHPLGFVAHDPPNRPERYPTETE